MYISESFRMPSFMSFQHLFTFLFHVKRLMWKILGMADF